MAFEDVASTYPDELPAVADYEPTSHQRSPRTNPAMRDGDSVHGNPNETAVDEVTTDNDTGDGADEPAVAGFDGGAVEGTTADLRGDGDDSTDFTLRQDVLGDGLGVMDDEPPPADGTELLPPQSETEGESQLPIRGYGRMTVKEVIEQSRSLSPVALKQLRDFEATHRNRKTLIAQLDRMSQNGQDG